MPDLLNSLSKEMPNTDRVSATELYMELLLNDKNQKVTLRELYTQNLKEFQLKYRRKRIHHKLVRIQKEFQFVKSNINNYQELTHREKEVLRLLTNGYNNPEIGEQLFISRYTVEQHRKNINRKLKTKSFIDLIRYSYAFDMV